MVDSYVKAPVLGSNRLKKWMWWQVHGSDEDGSTNGSDHTLNNYNHVVASCVGEHRRTDIALCLVLLLHYVLSQSQTHQQEVQ